ncbi:aspartic peptidase domain-containing protein [Amylocarpus encephaloides]|uniref:Aspartic peptidase domain-containing protein n=1 Tax=Amylocarpus encephaloides TaxID=45428 RepID=A0A9P7Y8M6_9HELO|nr:aspartic peptidase domain-containing protein [Amylocarpus encephaloides]
MRLSNFSTFLLIARFVSSAECRKSRDVSLSPRRAIAAPIVVAAAQNWDGIDGSWSTFAFQVGTPTQNVRLFISTALHQTSVVVPQGCVRSDPADCANLRGGEFRKNQSTSYVKNVANLTTNIYPVDLGANTDLGYTARAEYGFDDITIGWQGAGGPGLKNQTIAGIAAKDSYLGLFGLVPRASNFTTFNNPIPSTMQDLRSQSKIPGLSWAYTAGNQYRLAEVLGSLTLGGYDRSKFVAHDITWAFNSQDLRDLTVQINSITSSSTAGETSLLPISTAAFLDSGTPYIWLPTESCALFEKAFNLTWDNTTKIYPISDSQHTTLLAQSPNITFTLGNLTAGFSINITLPYAAFDLTAQFPLVANTTKYFPLKRANGSQVTLGRTFFQEAYVIADYDRRNFSVSQCKWTANAAQDIVPILSPELAAISNSNSTTSTGDSSTTGSKKAPIGAMVGGVIGGLVALGAAAYLIFHSCVKPHRRAAKAAAAAALATSTEKANPPEQLPTGEEFPFIKPELDSTQSPDPISEMEPHVRK